MSDPIILIVLFAEPQTIQAVHVNAGFTEEGKPRDASPPSWTPPWLRCSTSCGRSPSPRPEHT